MGQAKKGIADDCDLPCQAAPMQGIFFCPNGPLSQKELFTVCATVPPGPVGHLQMPLANSANTSRHTLSSQTGPLKQLISTNTNTPWVLTASGGQENAHEASSGHPASPGWGRRAEQQLSADRPRPLPVVPAGHRPMVRSPDSKHLQRPHSEPGPGEPLQTTDRVLPSGAPGISRRAPPKYPKSQGQPPQAQNFWQDFCFTSHAPARFAFSLMAQFGLYQWS